MSIEASDPPFEKLLLNESINSTKLLVTAFKLLSDRSLSDSLRWEQIIINLVSMEVLFDELRDKDWNIQALIELKLLQVRKNINTLKQTKDLSLLNSSAASLFKSVVSLLSSFSLLSGLCTSQTKLSSNNSLFYIIEALNYDLERLLNSQRLNLIYLNEELVTFKSLTLNSQRAISLIKDCLTLREIQFEMTPILNIINNSQITKNKENANFKISESYLNEYDNFLKQTSYKYSKDYICNYVRTVSELCNSTKMKSIISYPKMNNVISELLELRYALLAFYNQTLKRFKYSSYVSLMISKTSSNFNDRNEGNKTSAKENQLSHEVYNNLIENDAVSHIKQIITNMYTAFEKIYTFCGFTLHEDYNNVLVVQELSFASVISLVVSLTGRLFLKNLVLLTEFLGPYIDEIRKSFKLTRQTSQAELIELSKIDQVSSSSNERNKSSAKKCFEENLILDSTEEKILLEESDFSMMNYLFSLSCKKKDTINAPVMKINKTLIWLIFMGDAPSMFTVLERSESKEIILETAVSSANKGLSFLANSFSSCFDKFCSILGITDYVFTSPINFSYKLHEILQLRFHGIVEAKLFANDVKDNVYRLQNGMFNNFVKTFNKYESNTSLIRLNNQLIRVILDYIDQTAYYGCPLSFIKLPDYLKFVLKMQDYNKRCYLQRLSSDVNLQLTSSAHFNEIALFQSHKTYEKLLQIENLNFNLLEQFEKYLKGTFERHLNQLSSHTSRLNDQNLTVVNNSRVMTTQSTLIKKFFKDITQYQQSSTNVFNTLNDYEKSISKFESCISDLHNCKIHSKDYVFNQLKNAFINMNNLESNLQCQINDHKKNLRQTKLYIENLKSKIGNAETSIFNHENIFLKIQQNCDLIVQKYIAKKFDKIPRHQIYKLNDRIANLLNFHLSGNRDKDKSEVEKYSFYYKNYLNSLVDEVAYKNDLLNKVDLEEKIKQLQGTELLETKIKNDLPIKSSEDLKSVSLSRISNVINMEVLNEYNEKHDLESKLLEYISKLQNHYKNMVAKEIQKIQNRYADSLQDFKNSLETCTSHINTRLDELTKKVERLQQLFIDQSTLLLNSILSRCRQELSQYLSLSLGDYINLHLEYNDDQSRKLSPPKFRLYENEALHNTLLRVRSLI